MARDLSLVACALAAPPSQAGGLVPTPWCRPGDPLGPADASDLRDRAEHSQHGSCPTCRVSTRQAVIDHPVPWLRGALGASRRASHAALVSLGSVAAPSLGVVNAFLVTPPSAPAPPALLRKHQLAVRPISGGVPFEQWYSCGHVYPRGSAPSESCWDHAARPWHQACGHPCHKIDADDWLLQGFLFPDGRRALR